MRLTRSLVSIVHDLESGRRQRSRANVDELNAQIGVRAS
jgi:hypothetical protein